MARSRYKIYEEEYPYFITSSITSGLPLFGSGRYSAKFFRISPKGKRRKSYSLCYNGRTRSVRIGVTPQSDVTSKGEAIKWENFIKRQKSRKFIEQLIVSSENEI
jgi:hypothetical protein